MLLSELLHENTIILNIDKTDRFELIDFLIKKLQNIYCLDNELILKIRDKIINREQSMSTGLGKGIAAPHAEVDGVKSTMALMAVTRKGIDFKSLDGLNVRIVILLVMPEGQFKEHIMTLSGIAHLLRNQLLRHQILLLKTPEKIFSCILSEEINELLKY